MKLKKLIPFFICLLTGTIAHAQIKAVTETGDEVILSGNGTWRYVEEVKNNDSIKTNPVVFTKAATASFLLKSKKAGVGIWLNSKKWNFEKSTDKDIEYSFSLKENTSVGAFVIAESVSMEMQSLRKFAIKNIQDVSSNFKLTREEYRNVNGIKMLLLEFNATVEGIQIVYFNYYYTDAISTVQFDGYIPQNMAAKYKPELEELLNGLVITDANSNTDPDNLNNAAMQSSLVEGSDCRPVFTGSWSYVANGKKYIDKIEGGKMFESSADKQSQSEYKFSWVDKCRYELTLVRSNDPATQLIKPGAVITIDIMEIDNKHMRYQLSYGEKKSRGEMKKEE